ncbi:Glycogenin [Taphrina deformans PYCC 5710]|uniref:glycogenin glucosyltransferase n=1 Tax=Taphrina deformans (strain PYCC 5710 / ATCC 11124 / CBS 356.35 / IMI 108563 / JCM 9778 / NBRC 8474) TaxID=1097556 RepID=R4XL60_TAPDE|nr:Glycogenin [Taphrina deformans PYCC 5710]|eukprot:CCG85130.1 Glycogenin [Taphrina deformans PYCC 5710]
MKTRAARSHQTLAPTDIAMSAYVTLLLNDGYVKGAQVLGHSLRDLGVKHELVVLVTRNVSATTLAGLMDIYDQIIEVEEIANPSLHNLNLLGRLDLRSTLTKLNIWRLIQYKKIVYLDADTVVLQNLDHLFDLEVEFAAAPDIGWPDIFNSGVFFSKPNIGTYAALRKLAEAGISFDGGDQGLLNTFFSNYTRLSFTYNVTTSSGYQYLPAFRHFESQLKVAHFIGAEKPWNRVPGTNDFSSGPNAELVARWWAVYERHYPSNYVAPTVPYFSNKSEFSTPASALSAIREEAHPDKSASPVPFEAQHNVWDGQRTSPPSSGVPEAADLQFMSYSNSWDNHNADQAFVPPSTPRIPKSVHFEPPSVPDASKKIFPWEGTSTAQRSFPEDAVAPLQEIITIERNPTPQSDQDEQETTETIGSYQFSNAWDSIQEIKDYVAKMPGSSTRPRAPSSTWGSGSNTPREAEMPEGQSKVLPLSTTIPGSQAGAKTDFLLNEPADLPKPQDWNPSAQLDRLASRAVTLAHEAADRKSMAAPSGAK